MVWHTKFAVSIHINRTNIFETELWFIYVSIVGNALNNLRLEALAACQTCNNNDKITTKNSNIRYYFENNYKLNKNSHFCSSFLFCITVNINNNLNSFIYLFLYVVRIHIYILAENIYLYATNTIVQISVPCKYLSILPIKQN